MMKTTSIILIAAASLILAPRSFAQQAQKLTATKANDFGLVYTLPLTGIDVVLEAERTVATPGEFYAYAGKYLGIDPIKEPSDSWTIKSVTVVPRGVADPEERYLVQLKSGQTPFIMLDENDFPLAVNTEELPESAAPELPQSKAPEPTVLQTPAASQALTQEMLQATSLAKRAELAAARIFELRQSRNDIITGNADQMPSDGQAMKLALERIDRLEAALTAMFAGTRQTSTSVRTFTVVPDGDDEERHIAGRLSATSGPVESDDLTGMPLYVDVRVTERGELPLTEKGETRRLPKGALAYRIPGMAEVTVTAGGRTVATARMPLAQAGTVFGLEPDVFTDKKAPAYAIFDPATGALRELGTR